MASGWRRRTPDRSLWFAFVAHGRVESSGHLSASGATPARSHHLGTFVPCFLCFFSRRPSSISARNVHWTDPSAITAASSGGLDLAVWFLMPSLSRRAGSIVALVVALVAFVEARWRWTYPVVLGAGALACFTNSRLPRFVRARPES